MKETKELMRVDFPLERHQIASQVVTGDQGLGTGRSENANHLLIR